MTASPLPTPTQTEIGGRILPGKLRSEWPLLVFTLLVAGLVAFVTAQLIEVSELHWPAALTVGIGAMMVSTLHLGKPTRAWRAVLNFRTSWVSREVALYSLFLGSVLFLGVSGSRSTLSSLLAVGLGFATLLSMDMVYNIPGLRVPTVPHSAMTTLTALFLLGLWVGSPWIALPAAALKIVLYLSRPVLQGPGWRALATLRLGLGFLLPALVWMAGIESMPLLLGGPLLAETLDRAQFYAELDFLTPRRQIRGDLAALLATDKA
jgi:DMSO reductase anchor subunit